MKTRTSKCIATIVVLALLEIGVPRSLEAQVQFERRRLPATVVIDGITCAATGRAFAEFYPSGRLAECPLAADTVLSGQALAKGTWVGFTEDGHLRNGWLSRDTQLSGYVCRGTGYKGFRVLFYASGSLRLCFLPADTEIAGVPCMRGTFWTEVRGGGKSAVSFRENGSLERCQAARAFTRDGTDVRKWDVVILDEKGRLVELSQRP